MKVLLIHGQNHQGTSYHMGRMLAGSLAKEEDIIEFFLPKDLNHFCLGCYKCIEDITKCPFYSEKKKFLEAFKSSDVFIFTTPNYCLGPSGAMKSFLDLFFDLWVVHRPEAYMFKKRAVVFSSSAGASCKGPLSLVRKSLSGWGMPEIISYGEKVAAMNYAGVKEKKKAKIERRIAKISKKLLKEEGKLPHVKTSEKIYVGLMGLMHKKGWNSSPKETEYWKNNGWLDGAHPYDH